MVGTSSADIRLSAPVKVSSTTPQRKAYDLNTTFGELAESPIGSRLMKLAYPLMLAQFGAPDPDSASGLMVASLVNELPLRNIVRMGGGVVSGEDMGLLIDAMNGKRRQEEVEVVFARLKR